MDSKNLKRALRQCSGVSPLKNLKTLMFTCFYVDNHAEKSHDLVSVAKSRIRYTRYTCTAAAQHVYKAPIHALDPQAIHSPDPYP